MTIFFFFKKKAREKEGNITTFLNNWSGIKFSKLLCKYVVSEQIDIQETES